MTLSPVAARIFAILPVDGHRGWPYLDQRLLLLNIVGSKPLRRARPEHDILCSLANRSIAYQTSLCVILFTPVYCFVCNNNIIYMGIFPAIPFLYATAYNLGTPAQSAQIRAFLTVPVKTDEYFLRKNFFLRINIKENLGFLSYFFTRPIRFFLKINTVHIPLVLSAFN